MWNGKPVRILVVDDQPEVRNLVRVTLQVGDFDIVLAEDGTEALRQVALCKPALIVLDVHFPTGPDGVEVCRQLKSDPDTAAIRVILLTSLGKGVAQASREAGADEFLAKPFSPLHLLGVVDRLLAWPSSVGN